MRFTIAVFTGIFCCLFVCCNACEGQKHFSENTPAQNTKINNVEALPVFPGIYNVDYYLPQITGKRVAVVANHASIIDTLHLVDFLIQENVNVIKAFCPEHGFRGNADAGQDVDNEIDTKTGLEIISLYGNNKKPKPEQLINIDYVVFDLQDVGVRFYTYISTLHYVMEACAENEIPLIVLDRPNPHVNYVDGPVLDTANYKSFVGMHPVPIVYGMTIGEYARMINGEGWLTNKMECQLSVVECKYYNRRKKYSLPKRPSPNLPNARSIELYPTLCIFEATCISVGRGTDMQFQVLGHPAYKGLADCNFSFTPMPNEGASNPLLNGKLCFGVDLRNDNAFFDWEKDKFNISVIQKMYELFPDKTKFFNKNNMLEKLIGNKDFRSQIEKACSESEIRETWANDIENFMIIRNKYLLYK